jgi:hypothetical protein
VLRRLDILPDAGSTVNDEFWNSFVVEMGDLLAGSEII